MLAVVAVALLCASISAAETAAAALDSSPNISALAVSSFSVVVCNATRNLAGSDRYQEEDAAEDVHAWLSMAVGHNLTLHQSNDTWCAGTHRPSVASPVIAIGPAAALWCGLDPASLGGLGLEGVLVTSVGVAAGCVAATGAVGAPRGTLYAGTELLELLGFRFLHEEQTVLPAHNVTMPPTLHRRHVPQLEYRASDDFTATVTPRWVQHARINSLADWGTRWNRELASGGSFDYAQGPPASNQTFPGFSHTAFNLVPPYLRATHPEWFGGDPHSTVPVGGQLCWAAPGLVEFLTARAQEFLRGPSKGAKIISISNNDAAPPPPGVSRWCNRSFDAAIIEAEGSPMGPLLRAVNAVAAGIEEEFPDVAVSTMAYQHTMQPPRLTKPRPNVLIRLCVGYNSSFSVTTNNQRFQSQLAGWKNISSRVYLWDYRANFYDLGFLSPYPAWATLQPNMQAFVAAGVTGVFWESDMTNLYGDLQELGMYINAMVAWDAQRWTYQQMLQDFVPAFYSREAAPFVLQYIEMMSHYAERYGMGDSRNGYLGNEVGFCFDYLIPGAILSAGQLAKAAFGAVVLLEPSNPYLDRVLRMQLPIYVTLLGRWEEMWDAAHNPQSPWWNPADPPPTWPFETTKQGAFAHFVDIFNRTDPAGLPASDYAEPRDKSNANHFTFDAGYDDLNRFEQRVFGRGSYAAMTPMCRPMVEVEDAITRKAAAGHRAR